MQSFQKFFFNACFAASVYQEKLFYSVDEFNAEFLNNVYDSVNTGLLKFVSESFKPVPESREFIFENIQKAGHFDCTVYPFEASPKKTDYAGKTCYSWLQKVNRAVDCRL